MSRKSARENAFKMIYSCALMKEPPEDLCAYFDETIGDEKEMWATSMTGEDVEYMRGVVYGAAEKKDEINEKIAPLLKKWDMNRLPKVSLALLQLAIYEIDNLPDVPDKVAVNEAVSLAKSYGDDASYKFINGILAEYLKSKN
jgi:N utilization substance protein B